MALAAIAAALLLACTVFISSAWAANKTLEVPFDVTDEATHVEVGKLDSDTHDYVEGAKLAIIEKESGNVIDRWTTGQALHENKGTLVVGTTYILRELSAPEGYAVAPDAEFVVNENEGEGVSLLSTGDGAELIGTSRLNMYDTKLPAEKEVVETRERQVPTGSPTTGDPLPIVPIAAGAGVSLAAIIGLLVWRRRSN